MEIKNYPELCKVLEIDRKTSNSKKKQFKDLEQFVHFVQEGRKFIIKEIYPHAKARKDGRKSIYEDKKLMELLIADYLIDSKKNQVVVTRNQMLRHIHAINDNYSYCSANVPAFSKYAEIPEQIVYDFFNTTNSTFRSAFIDVLEELRDKALIIYDMTTTVAIAGEKHREATQKEKELILKLEKETLEEFGFEKLTQARMSRKWLAFDKRIKKRLEKESKINFYYTSYKITVNREFIENEHNNLLKKALEESERELQQSELNANVCKRLSDNADKRKQKLDTKMAKWRKKERYIEDNKHMITLLVDRVSDNVVNQVRIVNDEIEDMQRFAKENFNYDDIKN